MSLCINSENIYLLFSLKQYNAVFDDLRGNEGSDIGEKIHNPRGYIYIFLLRWYGTPPYCDVLPIEINKKFNLILYNFSFTSMYLTA